MFVLKFREQLTSIPVFGYLSQPHISCAVCSSAFSAVSVLGLVHGSGEVERLQHAVQSCDSAIFLETSDGHGQHGHWSESSDEVPLWDRHKRRSVTVCKHSGGPSRLWISATFVVLLCWRHQLLAAPSTMTRMSDEDGTAWCLSEFLSTSSVTDDLPTPNWRISSWKDKKGFYSRPELHQRKDDDPEKADLFSHMHLPFDSVKTE